MRLIKYKSFKKKDFYYLIKVEIKIQFHISSQYNLIISKNEFNKN